jgi:predicted 2-oxoglutarate/Fe(II)-dependent dioxygenase YbiX
MPRAGFFALLGWFVKPGFFEPEACTSMRREMTAAPREAARILDGANQLVVDAKTRQAELVQVSCDTRAMVTSRLMDILPALKRHFAVELSACEPPSFLMYKPGAYYTRHVDANHGPAAPVLFRQRRVSISIFLNGEGSDDEPDTYSGGTLTFSGTRYDLLNGNYSGIALTGERGLLVAFPSDWPHEVEPVGRGVRYSIVTWFA